MKPRRAFTLVEMIVALAVITLLVAIALPSLAGARRESRRAACLVNLRSLGQGLEAYRHTFRSWPVGPWHMDVRRGPADPALALAEYLSGAVPRLEPGGGAHAPAPWRCPADRVVAPVTGSSYGYKVGLALVALRVDGMGERQAMEYAQRLFEWNAARQALFTDANINEVQRVTGEVNPAPWHGRGPQGETRLGVFLDGSARWDPRTAEEPRPSDPAGASAGAR